MNELEAKLAKLQAIKAEAEADKRTRLKAAEEFRMEQYPHLGIVPGSARQDDDHPVYAAKIRMLVTCGCGAKVERATSDFHTFKGCPTCMIHIRGKAKMAKKGAVRSLMGEIETLKREIAAQQAAQQAALAAIQTITQTEPTSV